MRKCRRIDLAHRERTDLRHSPFLNGERSSQEHSVVKVVVVDDSLVVQQSLGRLLTAVAGIEVVGYAEDVAGALRLIDSKQPDVVVLDVDLRDGNRGIDVLRHVVREHPGIKVIALSNFTWQAMRDGFLEAGASAYFDKSMEFRQARDWIEALLPGKADGDATLPVD
jgi:DNA-binding NarL/FixJ family response regulator